MLEINGISLVETGFVAMRTDGFVAAGTAGGLLGPGTAWCFMNWLFQKSLFVIGKLTGYLCSALMMTAESRLWLTQLAHLAPTGWWEIQREKQHLYRRAPRSRRLIQPGAQSWTAIVGR